MEIEINVNNRACSVIHLIKKRVKNSKLMRDMLNYIRIMQVSSNSEEQLERTYIQEHSLAHAGTY